MPSKVSIRRYWSAAQPHSQPTIAKTNSPTGRAVVRVGDGRPREPALSETEGPKPSAARPVPEPVTLLRCLPHGPFHQFRCPAHKISSSAGLRFVSVFADKPYPPHPAPAAATVPPLAVGRHRTHAARLRVRSPILLAPAPDRFNPATMRLIVWSFHLLGSRQLSQRHRTVPNTSTESAESRAGPWRATTFLPAGMAQQMDRRECRRSATSNRNDSSNAAYATA